MNICFQKKLYYPASQKNGFRCLVLGLVYCHLYHYANNNPIKYVDPNGQEIAYLENEKYEGKDFNIKKYIKKVESLIKNAKKISPEFAAIEKQLREDKNIVIYIMMTDGFEDSPSTQPLSIEAVGNLQPTGSIIRFNPYFTAIEPDTNLEQPPITGIVHEFQHAYDHKIGTFDGKSNVWITENGTQKYIYNKFLESRAVNLENSVRIPLGLEYRKSYGKYSLNLIPESYFRRNKNEV